MESWDTSNQWSTFTYEDTVSWINWATTTSCTISSEWSASTCTTSNTKICNNAWLCNTTNQTSNSIKLDKTAPTLKSKTTYGTSWYTSNQWSTFTYEDTVSWINWATTTSCTISSEWSASTCKTSNTKDL